MRVRSWENKNVLIRRNLNNQQGLVTEVWDAWLRKSLRSFGGFEQIIEVDTLGDDPQIRFFSVNQLPDIVHYILHSHDPEVAVS